MSSVKCGLFFLAVLALTFAGQRATAQQVIGVSAILDVSDSSITTYSATEVDYQTAAYYQPYVAGFLYQDGSQIGAGSATSNTVSNRDGSISSTSANGCMQQPVMLGSQYQFESDHYLIAAFSYYDGSGAPYFSNPSGFLPAGDGSEALGNITISPGGGAAYVTYQYIYLGTTALPAAAPTTLLSNGSLAGAVQSWQDNGNGTYTLTLSPLAWNFLTDNGFINLADTAQLAPIIFVPGAGEVVIAVAGAVVVTVAVVQLYDWWIYHKNDAVPNLPRPKNAPSGTVPIDKYKDPPLSSEQIHDIKNNIGHGAPDWTGVAPNGEVIGSDVQGNAENYGPWRDLTNH